MIWRSVAAGSSNRVGRSPSAITGKSSRGKVERLNRERPATTCILPSAAVSSTWLPSGSLRTMSKKVCADTVVAPACATLAGRFHPPAGRDRSPPGEANRPRALPTERWRESEWCSAAPRPIGRGRGSSGGPPVQSSLSSLQSPIIRTRNGTVIASRSARGSGEMRLSGVSLLARLRSDRRSVPGRLLATASAPHRPRGRRRC